MHQLQCSILHFRCRQSTERTEKKSLGVTHIENTIYMLLDVNCVPYASFEIILGQFENQARDWTIKTGKVPVSLLVLRKSRVSTSADSVYDVLILI